MNIHDFDSVLGREPILRDEPRIPCNRDFVFLDDANRPFRVRKLEDGEFWLLWWHADKKWVTLRPIDSTDALKLFLRRSLNREQTLLYEAGVPFYTA